MSIPLDQCTVMARSPLDAAEHTFQLVACHLTVNGRLLDSDRAIPLDELRARLSSRTLSNAGRDAIWRDVIIRARREGPQWLVAAVGLAVPLLRNISDQICHGFVAGESADIDTEVLTRFIEAVRTIDLVQPNILPRMRDAAKQAGIRARQHAESEASRCTPWFESAEPQIPWGHPDLVLADAVDKGVINRLDAELIGLTRLEHRTLADAAERLGLSTEAAKKRRQRAEAVLVKAVIAGEVESAMSPTITSDLPRRSEAESPARGRTTSDPQPLSTEPKGGRGNPTGSARTPLDIRIMATVLPTLLILAAIICILADPANAASRAAPSDLNAVFTNIRNWLIGLLVSLATLMLTLGGLRYLVAGGDPGEVQKAKLALKAAAFGYGLAVLAPLLVNVLKSVVGG